MRPPLRSATAHRIPVLRVAFDDGFKRLRLSNVDSRLRRIDGYGGRALLDALSWSRGEGNGKERQQEGDG
jgi:hypothetical protein